MFDHIVFISVCKERAEEEIERSSFRLSSNRTAGVLRRYYEGIERNVFLFSISGMFFFSFSVLSNFSSVYRTSTIHLTENTSQQPARSETRERQNVKLLDSSNTNEIQIGEGRNLVLLNARVVIIIVVVYTEKQ